MRFVIVTGMSGAGKSSVLKMLEDVGYFCMDNLPVSLVPKLTELLSMPNSSIDKVALGMEVGMELVIWVKLWISWMRGTWLMKYFFWMLRIMC